MEERAGVRSCPRDHKPEQRAPEKREYGNAPEYRTPAEGSVQSGQGRGGKKGAQTACCHEDGHQTGVYSGAEPVAHDFEGGRGHHRHADADQGASGKRRAETGGRGEEKPSNSPHTEEQKHGSARPPVVYQQPGWNLRGRIGVQEGGTEPAGHGGRQAQIFRQRRHDHAEAEALEEYEKIRAAQGGEQQTGVR